MISGWSYEGGPPASTGGVTLVDGSSIAAPATGSTGDWVAADTVAGAGRATDASGGGCLTGVEHATSTRNRVEAAKRRVLDILDASMKVLWKCITRSHRACPATVPWSWPRGHRQL